MSFSCRLISAMRPRSRSTQSWGLARMSCILSFSLRGLLEETFGFEGFLHFRPCADAPVKGCEVRPSCEVDLGRLGPAEEHEEIRVGHGEPAAHEVILAGELLVQPVEARSQV